MSWSAVGKITVRKDSNTVVDFPGDQPQTGHGEAESVLAIASAKVAAQTLLESGVLGFGAFKVYLNGHANPGNKPDPGWANDHMQISLSQLND